MVLGEVLFFGVAFTVGAFLQGLTGFGYALLVVPILSLAYGTTTAVAISAVTAVFMVVYNFLLHREHVEYRRVLPLGITSLFFIPVGAYFLHNVPENTVTGILGLVVIVLTVANMALGNAAVARSLCRYRVGYLFSVISGLLAGAYATAGPGMVSYLYATDTSRMRAKANAQAYFITLTGALLLTHVLAGTITPSTLPRSLPFAPLVLAGTKLGAVVSGRVPVRGFKLLTDLLLIALGIYLLVNSAA